MLPGPGQTQRLTRRFALKLGLSSLLGASLSAKGCVNVKSQAQSLTPQFASPSTQTATNLASAASDSLKAKAAAKGILFGAAAGYPSLSADPNLAAAHRRESAILVPENELKFSYLRPQIDQFDYTQADWLADFARDHNMLFRGHTLIWDQALPDWFQAKVTAKNAEQFLIDHVTRVAKHYTGRVHSWDVVNEAVAIPYTNRADGLHLSPWLLLLGKSYIDLAFRATAEADPQAMLVYNDRWLDYETPRDNAQRAAVLNLLTHLKSIGTPIHALGIQAHLDASETRFNPELLRQFFSDVAALGLKILITELDVTDHQLPADIKIRDQMVAAAYEQYLSVALDEPAVIAVLTWGLSDRYTWLSRYAPRPDGLAVRPQLLDASFQRKPAWDAVARVFDQAPSR